MEMMQKWAANRAFMGQLQRHEGQGTARMNIGCCCERVPICRYGQNRTARNNIGSCCAVVWEISSDF